MSSKKYASPLQLELKPSRLLFSIVLALHTIALLMIYLLPVNSLLKLFTALLVISTFMYFVYYQAFRKSAKAIIKVIWDASDEWFLVTRSGEQMPANLVGDSFSHPRLAVLNFKIPEHFFQKRVVLLRDNVDENLFRRLRVRLKISSHHQTDEF